MKSRSAGLVLTALLLGCSSTPPGSIEPDMIDVTLSAPAEQVRTAVTDVLTTGGYDVEWDDDENLSTGYREETGGPWNVLYRWRFGTIKSRVEGVVTPLEEERTRLRLHVLTEGKSGLFDAWTEQESAMPQSARNQLRLIKNALNLL
jgi:hypothetical protein